MLEGWGKKQEQDSMSMRNKEELMGQVIFQKENHIAILSVDRPEALNALSREIVDEMDAFIEDVSQDNSIYVLVLYSEKNFAAGADIKAMVECDEQAAKEFVFSPTYNKIADLEIPVIAAIEGFALGGGLELALTADIRIAGENAKVGFPEVTLGIMPGAGGTIRGPKIIGYAYASELIFSGEIITAAKAKDIGLVNRVVPDDQVLEETMKLAGCIARRGPIAVRTAKKTIRSGLEEPDVNEAIAIEEKNWVALFRTEDQKEGMEAFIEKRKPIYKNR